MIDYKKVLLVSVLLLSPLGVCYAAKPAPSATTNTPPANGTSSVPGFSYLATDARLQKSDGTDSQMFCYWFQLDQNGAPVLTPIEAGSDLKSIAHPEPGAAPVINLASFVSNEITLAQSKCFRRAGDPSKFDIEENEALYVEVFTTTADWNQIARLSINVSSQPSAPIAPDSVRSDLITQPAGGGGGSSATDFEAMDLDTQHILDRALSENISPESKNTLQNAKNNGAALSTLTVAQLAAVKKAIEDAKKGLSKSDLDKAENETTTNAMVRYIPWPYKLKADTVPTISLSFVFKNQPATSKTPKDPKLVVLVPTNGLGAIPPVTTSVVGTGDSKVLEVVAPPGSSVIANPGISASDTTAAAPADKAAAPSASLGQSNTASATETAPQVHALSSFNLATGVVYSTVKNQTFGFTGSDCSKGAPSSTCTATVTGATHVIDPVLVFATYIRIPGTSIDCRIDAEREFRWSDLCPAIEAGLSLSSPGNNFYVGLMQEFLMRGIQINYGLAINKVSVLAPTDVISSPGSNNSPPASVQRFSKGAYIGLTFNLHSFIGSLFGGGGGGGGGAGSGKSGSAGSN
jgi:hypothetical protein